MIKITSKCLTGSAQDAIDSLQNQIDDLCGVVIILEREITLLKKIALLKESK